MAQEAVQKFAPIPRAKTLSEVTIEQLRDAILRGVYLPGQKLVETRVASELQISRAPLREAASALAEEGLLVKRPFLGYYVPELSHKSVIDLFSTRTALETLAVQQCWDGRDAAFRDEIDARHAALLKTIHERDQAEAIKTELRLHGLVYERSGNELLLNMWRMIAGKLQIYWSAHQRVHDRYGPLEDAHERYVALLKGDDLPAIEEEIRDHMQRGLATLVRRLDMMADADKGPSQG